MHRLLINFVLLAAILAALYFFSPIGPGLTSDEDELNLNGEIDIIQEDADVEVTSDQEEETAPEDPPLDEEEPEDTSNDDEVAVESGEDEAEGTPSDETPLDETP